MNILYCGDKNIENGLIISILSLLKAYGGKLNIYILTASYPEKNIKALKDNVTNYLDNLVKKTNSESFVQKIDISNLFKKELPIMNLNTRFTPCCMLRLFADEIPNLPSKILYLDNDVICRKDPTDLYNKDITDYELVGVLDYYGKWLFKKNIFKFDYLNSGVLLMNLDNIKKTNLFKKARKMCIEKRLFMPDQSALNKLCQNKLIVKPKFNEQKRLKKDTVLQHFTTTFVMLPYIHARTIKPWHIEKMHSILKIYEYDDILNEYLKIKEEMYEKEK